MPVFTSKLPGWQQRPAHPAREEEGLDAALALVLAQVLDSHRDTKQFALEVLSIGVAISLVTVSVTITIENGRLGKKALTPELAKAMGGWLNALKPLAGRLDG